LWGAESGLLSGLAVGWNRPRRDRRWTQWTASIAAVTPGWCGSFLTTACGLHPLRILQSLRAPGAARSRCCV